MRAPLASSDARDEIGDLSRSFGGVLARLSEYAAYQEKMASRLSHELRTPIAVVRSSLDNLNAASLPADARVYMARAREGIARLTQILTRMTEAARLEQSLSDVAREPFALDEVVASYVEGFRVAYPRREHRVHDARRAGDRRRLARPRGADARQAARERVEFARDRRDRRTRRAAMARTWC